jgi:hypothetical protein
MKKLLVAVVAVVGLLGASCIVTTSSNPCWIDGTCVVGASCDYSGDMDCISQSQAWWCSPSGYIQQVDCVSDTAANGGCADVGMTYAACGTISPCQDARCLCTDNPTVCGSTVTMGSCTGSVHCGP